MWPISFLTFLSRRWEKLNFSGKTSKEVLQEEECVLQAKNKSLTLTGDDEFAVFQTLENQFVWTLVPDQY